MPVSSTTRAWIVVAILLLLLLAGGVAFYFWQHRPLPPIVSTVPGAPAAAPPSDILSELPPDAPVVAYIDATTLALVAKFSARRRPGTRLARPASRSRLRQFRPRYGLRLHSRPRPCRRRLLACQHRHAPKRSRRRSRRRHRRRPLRPAKNQILCAAHRKRSVSRPANNLRSPRQSARLAHISLAHAHRSRRRQECHGASRPTSIFPGHPAAMPPCNRA